MTDINSPICHGFSQMISLGSWHHSEVETTLSYFLFFISNTYLTILWEIYLFVGEIFFSKEEMGKIPVYKCKESKRGNRIQNRYTVVYDTFLCFISSFVCVKAHLSILGKYRICPDAHEHIGLVPTSVTLLWKLAARPEKYHFCLYDR